MAKDPNIDEQFSVDGMSVRRVGKSIQWSLNRSPEEFARFKQETWKARPGLVEQIRASVEDLSGLIQKYSSFELVANLWLKHGVFDPETYREYDAPQRPHFIEYATLIELRSPEFRSTHQLFVDHSDIVRAEQLMEEILRNTFWYHLARNSGPNRKPENEFLSKAEFFGMLRNIAVGPPAHYQHWDEVLHGIFGWADLQQTLEEVFGLSYEELRRVVSVVCEGMARRLEARVRQAHASRAEIEANLHRYMPTGIYDGTVEQKAMFDRLRNMGAKVRKKQIRGMMPLWVALDLARTLSWTTEDLATLAGVSSVSVAKFLEHFKLGLGSTPKGFLFPTPNHSLQRRPIISADGQWFCPVPHRLRWAIKPAIEEALQGTAQWETYQSRRATYLVQQALTFIKTVLPQALFYENLFYPFDKDGREAELDALVIIDQYAYLIEGKAGTKRHGSNAAAVKATLDEVVGSAVRQALRARDYCRDSQSPQFRRSDGSVIKIDKTKVTEVIPIVISLDSLDVFTSELSDLRGILEIDESIWAVCLTDLREITLVQNSTYST